MRQVIDRGMAYGTGSGTANATMPQGNGQIVCRSLNFTSPDAGTLAFYRAKQKADAHAAVSASATLVIDTDAAGKVGGAVLTTNDYVLVHDSGGTGGWQLRSISNVAAVSSSTVTLTLGATITCAAGDTIFIVRAADIVTLTTAAETVRGAEYVFNGFQNMPVHALLTATGTCRLSIAYDVEG